MSLYRLLKNPYVTGNPRYEQITSAVVFDDIADMSALSYSRNFDQIQDEQTELIIPKLPDLEHDQIFPWQDKNPCTDSNTLSGVGLLFTATVAICLILRR
jgi:hypothetical protein